MKKIKVSIPHKNEIERFILISLIGMMDALLEDSLTIEDCENYLLNPYSYHLLEEKEINPDIVTLVHLGAELEDIESILPEKLKESIKDIREKAITLLRNTDPSENPYKVKEWIDE